MIELPQWIVPFEDWTIRGRWWPTLLRGHRAEGVIVHHSVTDTTNTDGLEQVREVEEIIWNRRRSSRFTMVAYCWLIDTSGKIYEGRGIKYRNGANKTSKNVGFNNTNTTSICFTGNYHPNVVGIPTLEPTFTQLSAAVRLIQWLELVGEIPRYFQVHPHSHLYPTSCCGKQLSARLPMIEMLAKTGGLAAGGSTMEVHKVHVDDTHGRVVIGNLYFESTEIGHWEGVVGSDNIFVSKHFPALYAGLKEFNQ